MATETGINYQTTASAPIEAAPPRAPVPIDDLEKRLAVLKAANVREYHDAGLKIAFEPARSRQAMPDPFLDEIAQLAAQAQAEREAAGG